MRDRNLVDNHCRAYDLVYLKDGIMSSKIAIGRSTSWIGSLICNQRVGGSNPSVGSNIFNNLQTSQKSENSECDHFCHISKNLGTKKGVAFQATP